ncbi:MAG TPA: HYR domain-containing protein [Ilumatobacteraceae bacterium]|nr:HYR domain-containing protein [Ilumatobacteraceae bacterium]
MARAVRTETAARRATPVSRASVSVTTSPARRRASASASAPATRERVLAGDEGALAKGCIECEGDQTSPTIVCPAVVRNVECAQGGVTLGLPRPSAADDCSNPTILSDAPPTYGVGVTNVTFTAVDGAGNRSSCTTAVEVRDTEPPTLFCPDRVTVEGDRGICGAYVDALIDQQVAVNTAAAKVQGLPG